MNKKEKLLIKELLGLFPDEWVKDELDSYFILRYDYLLKVATDLTTRKNKPELAGDLLGELISHLYSNLERVRKINSIEGYSVDWMDKQFSKWTKTPFQRKFLNKVEEYTDNSDEGPMDDSISSYEKELIHLFGEDGTDKLRFINDFFHKLTRPEQILFSLRYDNKGLSYRNIAKTLKIPSTSVYLMLVELNNKINKAYKDAKN